jgi:hypothetical protein
MSIEQQLMEHYQSTNEAVGGPDLATVLGAGRRRRRVRTGGAIGVAAALVTVSAVVVTSYAGGSSPTKVTHLKDNVAPAASSSDFVPGTDIDDAMQRVIAEHLPGLGDATDVYPSDWFHNGPMPDSNWVNATDWQAVYELDSTGKVLVIMGYPKPGESTDCPTCGQKEVPGGTLLTQTSKNEVTGDFHFLTSFVRDDGFTVSLIDYVTAPDMKTALKARSVRHGAPALVEDSRLHFPEPETPPTGP